MLYRMLDDLSNDKVDFIQNWNFHPTSHPTLESKCKMLDVFASTFSVVVKSAQADIKRNSVVVVSIPGIIFPIR